MIEKVIRSLRDLEDALVVAAEKGGCRIRVGEQVAALVVPEDLSDDEADKVLNHPAIAKRLNRAVRSLAEGRGVLHKEVLQRLAKKDV